MREVKNWKITKGVFGHKVNFKCPNCAAGLVSKLEEAGNSDQCPDCGRRFECPGKDYLAASNRSKELDAKKRQEEKERAGKAKAERKAEKARQKEEIRRKKEYETPTEEFGKEEPKAMIDRILAEKSEVPNTAPAKESSSKPSTSVNHQPDRLTKMLFDYSDFSPNTGTESTADIKCQHCGSLMFEQTKVTNDMTAQLGGVAGCLFGVILLVIGFLLFITFGVSGTGFFVAPLLAFIGLAIVAASSRVGHSKKRVMACNNCGYFFEKM